MQGPSKGAQEKGVMQRAVDEIFNRIEESVSGTQFDVSISMCDVCHKDTQDLLNPNNLEQISDNGVPT